eukprot:scaffold179100_cov26-Prasinocladus_malaysianus.AAC.2
MAVQQPAGSHVQLAGPTASSVVEMAAAGLNEREVNVASSAGPQAAAAGRHSAVRMVGRMAETD